MSYFFAGFDTWQIFWLCVSAVLIGINKTGMPGLGLLPVLLLTMFFDSGMSAGLQLLMLAAADVAAVAYYRKTANWGVILKLLPSALCGIGLGVLALEVMQKRDFSLVIGLIILLMCIFTLLKTYYFKDSGKVPTHWAYSMAFGMLAGFTTQVANAAGPVMAIYLLSMRFDKQEYMGTAAWYFLVLNWIKVPVFIAQGRISAASARADAAMVPFLALGAVLGVLIVRKLPRTVFERIVLGLSAVGALHLIVKWGMARLG